MGIELSETESMVFFYSVFLLASINAGIGSNLVNKKKHWGQLFITLSFLILFIPLGMRKVGIDQAVYEEWYYNAEFWIEYNYMFSPEPLFALLILAAKKFFVEFQIIYIFSAYAYLSGVYSCLRKSNCFGYLSVLFMSISLYLYMCGLARISIAIGLTSLATSVIEKKYKPLLLIVLASMFHYSALVMIMVYISYRSNKKFALKYILIIIFLLTSAFYMMNIYIYSLPYAFVRYIGYSNISLDLSGLTNVIIILPALLLWIIFMSDYRRLYEEKFIFIYNLWSIVIGLIVVSLMYEGVFRLTFYFYPLVAKIYYDYQKILFIKQMKYIVLIYQCVFTVLGLLYVYKLFFSSPFIAPLIIPFSL